VGAVSEAKVTPEPAGEKQQCAFLWNHQTDRQLEKG
jgi:hypothetical protein